MGPDVDSVILFASFKKTVVRFEPIFTPDGLCFTFNALNSRDIYTDEYGFFLCIWFGEGHVNGFWSFS